MTPIEALLTVIEDPHTYHICPVCKLLALNPHEFNITFRGTLCVSCWLSYQRILDSRYSSNSNHISIKAVIPEKQIVIGKYYNNINVLSSLTVTFDEILKRTNE